MTVEQIKDLMDKGIITQVIDPVVLSKMPDEYIKARFVHTLNVEYGEVELEPVVAPVEDEPVVDNKPKAKSAPKAKEEPVIAPVEDEPVVTPVEDEPVVDEGDEDKE